MFLFCEYDEKMKKEVFLFFEKSLPQTGRAFEPEGRHRILKNISDYYDYFLCLMTDKEISGTIAIKIIDNYKCELRSFYLLDKYHGKGFGRMMMEKAVLYAKENGYKEILLDTIGTSSKKAIGLYKIFGFVETEKYSHLNNIR